MKLPILCIALLLAVLVSSEPASNTFKDYDRHDFFFPPSEPDNFKLISETLDAANSKERDREPLLQDYILDNIEFNSKDNKIKNDEFFHHSLFNNKDTERVQIFKEYIPNNLIINDVKLNNKSNEANILPLFTDELNQMTNGTAKIDKVKVPDSLFQKKKADIQIIKDFASNIKLNEMVQTIKNFFSEKTADNIKQEDKVIVESNFTMNNIKVNDVVKSIKDYFSSKPANKTNDKLLVPKDFFSTKNKSLANETTLKNLVKKINTNKNRIFNITEKVVSTTDAYNDTNKIELIKNFLMEELLKSVTNKDLDLLENCDSFPQLSMNNKNVIEPIKDVPNLLMNNKNKEQTPQLTSPSGSQKKGQYKVHIVKIIFPEKISHESEEKIDTVKIPTEFLYENKKPPNGTGNDKGEIQVNKKILPAVIDVRKKIHNKPYKLTEKIYLNNNPKIGDKLKTQHNLSHTHHNNHSKTHINIDTIEDFENQDRIQIPKDFFPKPNNDSQQEGKTVINLNDFIPKEAVIHHSKGPKTSDLFTKVIQLKTEHKTKFNKPMDTNQSNLLKQTSKTIPNDTIETDEVILKIQIKKQHSNSTQKQKAKNTQVTINSQESDMNTPLITRTIFPEVLLKTDIEDYKKILVTNNLFKDDFVIHRANHDIISIILPLNSLNLNEIAKPTSDSKNYVIFFVEADVFPNSTKDYKGLYIYHNDEAKILLANGRDATAPLEHSNYVFIAADNGIYIYDHFRNSIQHYGTFNKSLIAISKTRNSDIIYALTDEKVLYNITNSGTQWNKVDKINKPEDIVLDYANNLYYYSADKIPYVFNGEAIIAFKDIPAKPQYIHLLHPPLVTESGIPAIIDDKSYILYSDGKVENADFEFAVYPTAFSVEAVIMQYFAYNKKLYKISCKQLYDHVN